MSSRSRASAAAGTNLSKFAYKPAGGGDADSPAIGGPNRARTRRRIVDDDEEVLTSPEVKRPPVRTIPRKKGAAAVGGAGASDASVATATSIAVEKAEAGPASDGGTSSGSEDNAWYRKPSSNAGIKVERPKAMAKLDGGSGAKWLSRNDPQKITAAQRARNIERAKAQRRSNRSRPTRSNGRGGGGDDEDEDASDEDNKPARSSGAHGKGTRTKHSAAAAAGRRRRGGSGRGGIGSESEESADTGEDSEVDEEEFEEDEDSSEGDSADDLELTDASEGDEDNPTTAAAAAAVSSSSNNNSKGSSKIVAGKSRAGAETAERSGTGSRLAKPSGCGAKGRGGAKAANGDAAIPTSNGAPHKSRASKRKACADGEVEVVGVKNGIATVGAVAKGNKRRRVQDSDNSGSEESDDSDGAQEVPKDEAKEGKEGQKKKKKMKMKASSSSRGDDDMDDSDRGSDSEEDGARARKVLAECSALSKKLASVISSWAGCEEDAGRGGGSPGSAPARGALELTDLKAGGKAVTTNDEIQEACPGLRLKPYQLVGVNWMCLLRETGVNGVLADEMGLGKTVQTIAFFALLRHRRKGSPPRRPHIVVVPSSVLDNWDSELQKFCPDLDLVKYHGSQKERASIRQSLNRVASGAERENMPDVILTTYVIWERESSGDDRSFLKRFKYDYMVLDEGHSIKNIKSGRFQRLRMVNARHRLLLSGTPVQNNLGELLALLSFLMPEIFRSDVIETLLEFLGESDRGEGSAVSFQVREVRGMLAPFVLRRLKASVLKQLVAKTETLEKVPLAETQRLLYKGVLEEHVRQKRAAIERALSAEISPAPANGGSAGRGAAADATRSGTTTPAAQRADANGTNGTDNTGALEAAGLAAKEIKNIFTELRKAANHPLMLLNHFKGGGKIDEVVNVLHRASYFGGQATRDMVLKEVKGYSDFDLHQICSSFDSLRHLCLSEETLFTSAKMQRLRTLLPELVEQGHRILLFSQWTRLLDLLEVLLEDSMGLKFCRLDGSTPVSERKALIDQFGSDLTIPVFLLSTRAGGLGINLTSADTVILHDVDFNPENDRQAEDRCHRIGQTRPVTVIKMVAEGTVDEDIYSMGERKKELNKSVLNDAASKDKDAASTISGILKRAIQVHMTS